MNTLSLAVRRCQPTFTRPLARSFSTPGSTPPPPPSSQLPLLLGFAGCGIVTYVGINTYEKYGTPPGPPVEVSRSGLAAPQVPLADTTTVFLKVSVNNAPPSTINLLLYTKDCPKTTANFTALCTEGIDNYKFKNSKFHRIIPGFMLQGGDVTNHDGTGGISLWGRRFDDENFKFHHAGGGVLSMANAGKNTNSSQFFLCTAKTSWLDGKHVVFGQVADEASWEVAKKIESYGTGAGTPKATVKIVDAGIVE